MVQCTPPKCECGNDKMSPSNEVITSTKYTFLEMCLSRFALPPDLTSDIFLRSYFVKTVY